MKYLGTKKNGTIRCERKDTTQKDYNALPAVYEFAKKTFKAGDFVKTEFEKIDGKGVIVKIEKFQTTTKKSYSGGSYTPANKGSIDAQSAVKSASQALAGIEGVTEKNYVSIYENLIAIGLKAILGNAPKASEPVKLASASTGGLETVETATQEDELE